MIAPSPLTATRLLAAFEATFRDVEYRHRNPQLGNRIAGYLFEDMYEVDGSSRFRRDVDSGRLVLNLSGVSPGVKSRRGDAALGVRLPSHTPVTRDGYSVPLGVTASVEIGAEVKILAKAMVKQIDRVISDLCRQAQEFRTRSPTALSVGIVGVNHAAVYRSYEGPRSYETTGKHDAPHPRQEAVAVGQRLLEDADGCFDEFLVLPFRATNIPPFDFEWNDLGALRDRYGAMLVRLLRRYQG